MSLDVTATAVATPTIPRLEFMKMPARIMVDTLDRIASLTDGGSVDLDGVLAKCGLGGCRAVYEALQRQRDAIATLPPEATVRLGPDWQSVRQGPDVKKDAAMRLRTTLAGLFGKITKPKEVAPIPDTRARGPGFLRRPPSGPNRRLVPEEWEMAIVLAEEKLRKIGVSEDDITAVLGPLGDLGRLRDRYRGRSCGPEDDLRCRAVIEKVAADENSGAAERIRSAVQLSDRTETAEPGLRMPPLSPATQESTSPEVRQEQRVSPTQQPEIIAEAQCDDTTLYTAAQILENTYGCSTDEAILALGMTQEKAAHYRSHFFDYPLNRSTVPGANRHLRQLFGEQVQKGVHRRFKMTSESTEEELDTPEEHERRDRGFAARIPGYKRNSQEQLLAYHAVLTLAKAHQIDPALAALSLGMSAITFDRYRRVRAKDGEDSTTQGEIEAYITEVFGTADPPLNKMLARAEQHEQFVREQRRQTTSQSVERVRNVFEAILKYGHDEDFEPEAPDDVFAPTEALPGTPEKIDVLRRRVELGLPLWHSEDSLNPDHDTFADILRDYGGFRVTLAQEEMSVPKRRGERRKKEQSSESTPLQ